MTAQFHHQYLGNFALSLAAAAERVILPYFRQGAAIDTKPHYGWDPVTEADRAGERAMRALIEAEFPEHGILGEEYGEKPARSPYRWILDPIDGTRSFVAGIPLWATLIGLTYEDEPVLGVMSQPYIGEIFFGDNSGAWLIRGQERQVLRTRDCGALDKALAGTSAPEPYRTEGEKRGLAALTARVKMMRFGGDAYFYAMVAAGQFDLALDAGLQSYDIAALIPIVRGAGGFVGRWDEGRVVDGGNIICAGSEKLLIETMALMRGDVL